MDDKSALSKLYIRRFPASKRENKKKIWKVLIDGYFQKEVDSAGGGKVLEIASGYGEFISQINGREKFAVDLNPDAAAFVGEEVSFFCQSSRNLDSLGLKDLNVVFISNFLEHLESKSDLEELLDSIHSCLVSGGKLIILGPNLRYLPGEYWDFYDHRLGLTHLSLSEILELKGFALDRVIPKFLPYSVNGRLPSHPLLVRLYLWFPLAWRILGRQFLVIASKEIVAN
ncbi:AdoMet_MTases domain containing protein [Microbacteriaceae bacterium]